MEKELSWGVSLADLSHLIGRIGELYAAMITRGQMAIQTNQEGYDVVSAINERISVKTVTSSRKISFNANTFDKVDRVMIFRLTADADAGLSLEILLDAGAEETKGRTRRTGNDFVFTVPSATVKRPLEALKVTAEVAYKSWVIRRYESGAIRIVVDNVVQPIVVKDVLRLIAPEVGVDVSTAAGEIKNTQQLGAEIIRAIQARSGV